MRLIVRRILIVLLIVWMLVVFGLSNQSGEQSGNLSRTIANLLTHGDTTKAEQIEPMIRKIAHMTEYAVGAMIFYGITLTYPKLSIKKRLLLSIIFVVLYASSDEFHQRFINARSGNVFDVIIDTVGGVMGLIGIRLIERTIIMMDNKVKETIKEEGK